jgi:MFS family permease
MNGLLLNETKNFNTAPSKPKISAIIDVPSQPPLEGGDDRSNKTTAPGAVKKLEESTLAGVLGSFSTAFAAWKKLLNDPNKQIRNIVTMNGLFWFALSGTQMTLLPLLMVGPRMSDAGTNLGLAMSAGEIGASFAFMSLVSFLFSQPMAYVADKYGKVPTILGGCALLSASMLALPLTAGTQATTIALPLLTSMHLPEYTTALVLVLLPFALGNTALNATPTALMSDLTEPSSRAQALSLLRTAGDCGLLLGNQPCCLFPLFLHILYHDRCRVTPSLLISRVSGFVRCLTQEPLFPAPWPTSTPWRRR